MTALKGTEGLPNKILLKVSDCVSIQNLPVVQHRRIQKINCNTQLTYKSSLDLATTTAGTMESNLVPSSPGSSSSYSDDNFSCTT